MKKLLALVALFMTTTAFAATDYSEYYKGLPIQLQQATAPTISNQSVNIKDYGAVGDGQTLCTEAVQKAIDELSAKGGGHVIVPAGIWVVAPIQLKSGIDLHLEANAILQMTEERSLHLDKKGKVMNSISAKKAHDISITGKGFIDGNGEFWRAVKKTKQSNEEWKQYTAMGGKFSQDGKLWYPFNLKHQGNIAADELAQEKMRVNLIRFTDCERVLIQGVTLQNSPKFHFTPTDCRDVIIDGVTVRCPWNAQNGDAIDIGCSQRVLIVNNTIDCGDDGICMKGQKGDRSLDFKACEDILIAYNTVFHAHGGFVIGSEFSAGMKKIVVHDNTFSGTDTGLRFKSYAGAGGKTEQIYCYNITMTDITKEAIVFETGYADVAVAGTTGAEEGTNKWIPEFKDIHIDNVVCNSCRTAIKAKGTKEMIHDIEIKNSVLFYTKTAKEIDAATDVKLNNVKILTYKKN
jgi:polygalacturonase